MKDPRETDFTGNLPGHSASDQTGNRIFGAFGGALFVAMIVIVAIIALIWWLSPR